MQSKIAFLCVQTLSTQGLDTIDGTIVLEERSYDLGQRFVKSIYPLGLVNFKLFPQFFVKSERDCKDSKQTIRYLW